MVATASAHPPSRPFLHDVAVALADEGVPVRAIARAAKITGEDLYLVLKTAISEGRLIELPKDDWPPASKREQRKQPSHNILNLDDDTLRMACASRFKMTRLQAAVFVTLLRRPEINKDQLHTAIEAIRPNQDEPTDQKMVDVVICHIRKKIKPFKITIDTIWGVGYSLPVLGRTLMLDMLAEHIGMPSMDTTEEAA